MKYTKETLKNKEVQFEIDLTKEEWEELVEEAYEHEKGKYSVQGFRAGKAPRNLIEKMYGNTVFYEHALEHAFHRYYGEILDKEVDVEPVASPSIDVKRLDKDGATILIQVAVKPEVVLGQYKGLEIKKAVKRVTKEEINAELLLEQEKASRQIEVVREVKEGDTVTMDFVGSIDGVKFDGGSAKDYDLEIGSKSFIPGFEDQVIGMKTGETKDIKVKFPENYHAQDLKGKESNFKVTIHKITEKQMPALDDELAKNMSEFETLKDWEADVKKHLQEKNAEQAKLEADNTLIQTVTDNAKVEVPEIMVEEQIDSFIKEFEYRLMYQGLKLEDYIQMMGTTLEDLRKGRRQDAIATVKTRLVLEAILKAEKIDVVEEEFKGKLAELAKAEGKSEKEFEKTLTEERINYIVNDLIISKLIDYLRKNNNLN
ncbi:MAG: trigger factor [Spirochaetales bacterium]